MKEDFLVTSFRNSIKLWLRRTLVLHQSYSVNSFRIHNSELIIQLFNCH